MKGAGFADQKQRRRNRFGYFLVGRLFLSTRIERNAISDAPNQNTRKTGSAHRPGDQDGRRKPALLPS